MTFDANPGREPVEVDLYSLIVARGVMALATIVPPEAPHPAAGLTGIIWQFGVAGTPDGHVRLFTPLDALADDLPAHLAGVLADAHDPVTMGRSLEKATEKNHGPGGALGPPVRCPGCNARLFGPVARRGGCLACYPDLPDDGPPARLDPNKGAS